MVTKFCEDVCNEICDLRSQGMDRSAIAKQVGINRRTLYYWIKQGEKARSGRKHLFYQKWMEADKQYKVINPPKNTYNKKVARELLPGYNKFKQNVLARDGHQCVCCGYDDLLEVHHLWGATENPHMATDVSNGVTLCKYCHQKYHHIYSRYDINPSDFSEFMNRFAVI